MGKLRSQVVTTLIGERLKTGVPYTWDEDGVTGCNRSLKLARVAVRDPSRNTHRPEPRVDHAAPDVTVTLCARGVRAPITACAGLEQEAKHGDGTLDTIHGLPEKE